jgi:hypothetical protein
MDLNYKPGSLSYGMIKAYVNVKHFDHLNPMNTNTDGLPSAELNKETKKSDDKVASHSEIARKAYFLHLNGGSGDSLSDWLLAEKEANSHNRGLHNRHN